MSTTIIEAVHRSVTVNVPPKQAFEVFVGQIGTWWPLESTRLPRWATPAGP